MAMSQRVADSIIDLALELFGDDYTDEQLEAAEGIWFERWGD